MRKVYAIGESLIDIIFSQDNVKAAKAGGSMLNTAVSCGRAGLNIHFLSEYGDDKAGAFINRFLLENKVDTRYVFRFTTGKTPIALAFLNEKGDASYEFYKQYPAGRLQLNMPAFQRDDIFLFGSFFGIDPAVRAPLMEITDNAVSSGVIIVNDPNFRKPHAHQLEELRPRILENMARSSIIKASDEDMELIFGSAEPGFLTKIAELANKPLIITQGAKGARLISGNIDTFCPANKAKVISTIGAGDNFNAGLIFGLVQQGVTVENLSSVSVEKWKKIIGFATAFAANVCESYDNYISEDFAQNLEKATS